MHTETIDGITHVRVDNNETEELVLLSIAKAISVLLCPTAVIMDNLKRVHKWPKDEELMKHIFLKTATKSTDMSKVVLLMNPCSSNTSVVLFREGENHFILKNRLFENSYGKPDALFEVSQLILENGGTEIPSYENCNYIIKGESLDLLADKFGFIRNDGESDWDFRKRNFIASLKMSFRTALQFLIGTPYRELQAVVISTTFMDRMADGIKFINLIDSIRECDEFGDKEMKTIEEVFDLLGGDPNEIYRKKAVDFDCPRVIIVY